MIARGLKDVVAIAPPLHEERLHGRDETLAALVCGLGESVRPAHLLHGPDGSGKTAIAAELARRARERGHDVWCIRAPDNTTLVVGLCAVADDLGLTGRGLTAAELCEAMWRRLETAEHPWLLIVDGADKPLGVPSPESGWLRPIRTGHGLVLVTTRDGDEGRWGPWWHRVFVGPVDDEATAAILRQWSAGEADVALVVASTGGLPLAARMTSAAIADGSPPAFRSAPALRAALEDGTWTREREDQLVYSDCVNRSLDALERQGMRHARPLLWLLTRLAPAPVPTTLLAAAALATSPYALFVRRGQGRRIRKTLLAQLMSFGVPALFPKLTEKQLQATVEALVDRGLLHAEPSGEVLLPTAVRVVCAERPFHDQYQMLAVWLLGRMAENESLAPEHPANWRMWYAIMPHATHVWHEVSGSNQPTLRSEPVIAMIAGVVEQVDRFLTAIGLRDLTVAGPQRATAGNDARRSVAHQFSAAFTDVVEAAARAMRSHPGLIHITDLVEVYGSVLRLSAQVGRIRRIINRQQNSSLRLAPNELLAFIAFFDLLGEFDTALSKVDAALLDIYRPGLVADLAEITGRDIDVLDYFNKALVTRYEPGAAAVSGLPAPFPPQLQRRLRLLER